MFRTLAIAIVALCLASLGAASPPDAPPPLSPRLDRVPLNVESLGLAMFPPLGALMQTERRGDRVIARLRDGEAVPTWSMSIEATAPEPPLTPKEQVDRLLARWIELEKAHEVVASEAVTYGGRNGHACWVGQKVDIGDAVVTGWLVLPAGDRELLVFTILTLDRHLDVVRELLGESFATVRLRDVGEIAGRRRTRLEAGEGFIQSLTPERLRSLVGTTELYRYYRPAGTTEPETELGYVRVELIEAKRGALNPGRPEANYDSEDQRDGFFARVLGRLVESADREIYVDSEMLFWLAWDQSDEAWSIRITRRQGRASKSEAETGLREARSTSNPSGSITVVTTSSEGARDSHKWRTPEVYLSQALKWALPLLLPRGENLDLSYYFYDSGSTGLTLRVDAWQQADDSSGRWILSTQNRPDAPAVESIHDSAGRLETRAWPDGSISEPITIEALHSLWVAKGLDTGATEGKGAKP